MKKFFKIFKAGSYPQLERFGVKEMTTDDLDVIVKNFSVANKVPITIDHKQEGPALGWVDGLKREGNFLMASFKDVNSDLKKWVKEKAYQGRSAEILGLKERKPFLRAVTFLGAGSPQINLGDIAEFKDVRTDKEIIAFSYDEPNDAAMFDLDEQTDDTIHQMYPMSESKPVDNAIKQIDSRNDHTAYFSMVRDSDEKDRKINELSKELKAIKEEKASFSNNLREKEAVMFLEDMVHNGKLPPREEYIHGIAKFMLTLENDEQVLSFKKIIMDRPILFSSSEETDERSVNFKLKSHSTSNAIELREDIAAFARENEIDDMVEARKKYFTIMKKEAI